MDARQQRPPIPRERGNALIITIFLLTVLLGLSGAHFMVVLKNQQASLDLGERMQLKQYAEEGIDLALHDLRFEISGADGKIGTAAWNSSADDVGADGIAGTSDAGEDDGSPTPGEPNLVPAQIGPSTTGARLLVYSEDFGTEGVKRIHSTAFSSQGSTTIQVYAMPGIASVPKVGAVYVSPDVALDLKGNAFAIDGNDTNPDGTPGPGPDVFGICTEEGVVPGENANLLIGQIPAVQQGNVTGVTAAPSVGEEAGVDFQGTVQAFLESNPETRDPGVYRDLELGDFATDDYRIIVVDGNLTITGNGTGAGVLIIRGSLNITGTFVYRGLVIVEGDVNLKGGGAGIHILGSLMVGSTLTAMEDAELGVMGTADAIFSSVVLERVEQMIKTNYAIIYWEVLPSS